MPRYLELPFDLSARGGYVHVTQGHDSRGSGATHNGDLRWSIDYGVPRWTPLFAQAAGVVVDLWEATADGPRPDAGPGEPSAFPSGIGNFVTIYYRTLGVYVTYAHLAPDFVLPSIGATVQAGEIVGYVGLTGARTGPHAHMQVGTQKVLWGGEHWVAKGTGSTPPYQMDTATGVILEGALVNRDWSLSWDTRDQNLTMIGSNDIKGWGNGNANTISGNRGDNYLSGFAGGDKIYGGDGEDIIVGGDHGDALWGGNDNDQLFGENHDDWLLGESGNDLLAGGLGADVLEGGTGSDTLYGEAGTDIVHGDSGNDILIGGAGADQLRGGTGEDLFVFHSAGDSSRSSYDTILDFERGRDHIDLRAIDANPLRGGDQAFSWIGNQSFHHRAGELRYEKGWLYGDLNGDGIADLVIALSGAPSVFSSDFYL